MVARGGIKPPASAPWLDTAPTTLAGVKQLVKASCARRGGGLVARPGAADGQVGLRFWPGGLHHDAQWSPGPDPEAAPPVLLAWGERLPWGGFVVHVLPLPQALPADDPVAASTAVNQAMEQLVAGPSGAIPVGYKPPKHPGT